MGNLKRDKNGRIYESSSDREDGKGFKSYATPVTSGDVTFGAVHSRALEDHAAGVKRDMMNRAEEDRQANQKYFQKLTNKFIAKENKKFENNLRDDDKYQAALLKKGAMQGMGECFCHENDSVNDQTQKAIKHHISGIGADAAFAVDPVEAYQAQLKVLVDQQIMQQARLDAKRNDAEVAATKALPTGKSLFRKRFQGSAPKVLPNPFAAFAIKTSK